MLKKAVAKVGSEDNPIIHSERGGHYRWLEWIEITKKAALIRSMSRKGCSSDNSACEGFFGRIKNEMFYNRDWHAISLTKFEQILDEYLNWYAKKRIKVSLGGLSPVEFRKRNKIHIDCPAWCRLFTTYPHSTDYGPVGRLRVRRVWISLLFTRKAPLVWETLPVGTR